MFTLFTAILLYWYAWETQGMRKAIVEQTNYQLMPMFKVSLTPDNLSITNIGNSVAFNVQADFFSVTADLTFEGMPFFFGAISNNGEGEGHCFRPLFEGSDQRIRDKERQSGEKYIVFKDHKVGLKIDFSDVSGKKYCCFYSFPSEREFKYKYDGSVEPIPMKFVRYERYNEQYPFEN